MGQERATPAINREKKKREKSKIKKEGKRKQTQKDRKKVIYNDKNNSCKARNSTVCFKQVCTHTHSFTHARTHMQSQVCTHGKANIAKIAQVLLQYSEHKTAGSFHTRQIIK